MADTKPLIMGRQSRKYVPRARTKRPLGLQNDTSQSPSKPHPAPTKKGEKWFLPNPLASRLFQKSGLGLLDEDGILLEPLEVMFCHWNRHIPISETWVNDRIISDSNFIAKSVVFDVARSGGEIVIPVGNLSNDKFTSNTFAVKWSRNSSHFSSEPLSQIRWFWASQEVDWTDLVSWVNSVIKVGDVPEIFVIDDEMDITMYRITYEELSGNQGHWNDLSANEVTTLEELMDLMTPTPGGGFIPRFSRWPLKSIGVEHLSGVNLRQEEIDWIANKLVNVAVFDTLFSHLTEQGCILRPGFKYGCKWRVYDDDVGKSHAPWLLQPMSEAPSSWERTCLSVRLAEGVHKKWVCGLKDGDEWRFLHIKRWLPGRV